MSGVRRYGKWHPKRATLLVIPLLVATGFLLNRLQNDSWTGEERGSYRIEDVQPFLPKYVKKSQPQALQYRGNIAGTNSFGQATGANSLGEIIAANLSSLCQGYRPSRPMFQMKVTTNAERKLLFCPMCKLASTYWTRFFVMLRRYSDPRVKTPYDIPVAMAPPTKENLKWNRGKIYPPVYIYDYKFMFVRNPYSRVLSAYVDKLFAPNPTFWSGICQKIIKLYRPPDKQSETCGSDLTFQEYVKAIVDSHKRQRTIDCHDAEFHSYCHACEVEYNFVGKMETFVTDASFLYRKLGLNKTLAVSMEELSHLGEEDALLDTVASAFRWKDRIKKCIDFDEALRRVWRKLQIRGVIGRVPYPLSVDESNRILESEFLSRIRKLRNNTPAHIRKEQRHMALVESYRDIPIELLRQLRDVYSKDFALFHYDPSPDYLFHRENTVEHFGYFDIYT